MEIINPKINIMKKSDYILISILTVLAIAGVIIKGYFGGLLTGSCAATLLFVTIGKIAYHKAKKRMDNLNEAIYHANSVAKQMDDSEPTNK